MTQVRKRKQKRRPLHLWSVFKGSEMFRAPALIRFSPSLPTSLPSSYSLWALYLGRGKGHSPSTNDGGDREKKGTSVCQRECARVWVIQKNHELLCCLNVPLTIDNVTLPWKILMFDWYGARWRRSAYVRQLVALIRVAWNESVLFYVNENAPDDKYNKTLQNCMFMCCTFSWVSPSNLRYDDSSGWYLEALFRYT